MVHELLHFVRACYRHRPIPISIVRTIFHFSCASIVLHVNKAGIEPFVRVLPVDLGFLGLGVNTSKPLFISETGYFWEQLLVLLVFLISLQFR